MSANFPFLCRSRHFIQIKSDTEASEKRITVLAVINIIIVNKMKMRLSRITEHNQFEETDHLYDPLRNTLKKSSVSKAKSLAHASSPHQLRGSNVSRVIRNLQPEEALEMVFFVLVSKKISIFQPIEGCTQPNTSIKYKGNHSTQLRFRKERELPFLKKNSRGDSKV